MATKDPGTLWVAATPLGNLGDISRNLAAALASGAHLFAEDTRRARILMAHLGVLGRVSSLRAHNERALTRRVLGLLEGGESCLLMSDAGTPAISDPGALVVAAAHAAGLPVAPVAGPSALAAALAVAGFSTSPRGVWFIGFLPTTAGPRARLLDAAVAFGGLWVAFESPRRTPALVAALAARAPTRPAVICRELTKVHEEVRRLPLAELAARLREIPPRGEITLVLGPQEAGSGATVPGGTAEEASQQAVAAAVARCRRAGLRPSEAARQVATVLGVSRSLAYAAAQADTTSLSFPHPLR